MITARRNLREPLASRDVALAELVPPPRDCRAVCSEPDGVPITCKNLRKPLSSMNVALAVLVPTPRDSRSVCTEADGVGGTGRRNLRERLASRDVAFAVRVPAPTHTPIPLNLLDLSLLGEFQTTRSKRARDDSDKCLLWLVG